MRSKIIFSRQASLARQVFLITPLHGARYKTGKTPKSSAMKSYVKLMRHPQHWYFPHSVVICERSVRSAIGGRNWSKINVH